MQTKEEEILYSNCSEAVFRFHTVKPKEMHKILQAIANEISANSSFEEHQKQEIPLFNNAESYDTEYVGASNEKYGEHLNKLKEIGEKDISDLEKERLTVEEYNRFERLKYPKGTILNACAGLGDNEAVIRVNKEKEYFTLNIGNNDISRNATGWVNKIKDMNIKVEEAEFDEELKEIARDCTCGITYGFQEKEND